MSILANNAANDRVPMRRNRLFSAAIAAVLIAVWAFAVWQVVWVLFADVADLGGAEVFVTYTLASMREGRPLYPNIDELPLAVTQYGPVFYTVCDSLNESFGIRVDQPERIAAVSRGVSSLAWVGVTALVLAMWRAFGFGWAAACGAATFTLICGGRFPFQGRPDALAILCSTASALLVWSADDGRSNGGARRLVLAGVLGCLAALAKQNAALSLAFAGAAAIIHRRGAVFAYFVVGFALVAVPTAAVGWSRYGIALKSHLIDGMDHGISVFWAFSKAHFPFASRSDIAFAVGVGLSALAVADRADPKRRTLAAFVLTSLAANGIATLKYGSAENYFMEFSVLAVILLGADLGSGRLGAQAPWLAVGFAAIIPIAVVQAVEFRLAALSADGFRGVDLAPLVAELDTRLAADPDALFYAADPRLPVLFPRRAIVGQPNWVSILFQRRKFRYPAYAAALVDGRLRYHVVDLKSNPVEKVYSDPTNFEHPLSGFCPVGRFGRFLLLENPLSPR